MLINNTNIHYSIPSIVIDNNTIIYSSKINNLGITIDNRLSFKPHTTEISKLVYHTLHPMRLIRSSITTDIAKLLVISLVFSRIDYCNSILNLLPQYTFLYSLSCNTILLEQYSAYINTLAHITPNIKSLHWLPIQQIIHYRILTLAYHAKYNNNPDYLTELLTDYISSRPQCNTNKYKLLTHNCANLSRIIYHLYNKINLNYPNL